MPFSPGLIFVQDGYICNGCGSASVVLIEVMVGIYRLDQVFFSISSNSGSGRCSGAAFSCLVPVAGRQCRDPECH